MEFVVEDPILRFIVDKPFLTVMSYLALNLMVYGFKGMLGGFLPMKVKLSVGSFYTSRRNAYRSECLTRIVQWRFFGGAPLPPKVREEVLDKYGPAKGQHYKSVIVDKEYKAKKG